MKLGSHLAACILLGGAGAAAVAQTQVYRCGPAGREYSQLPCPGGTPFDAADPRNADQRAQGEQAAERERRHATALERDRLAREASTRPSRALGIDSRRAATAPAAAASRPIRQVRKRSAKPVAPETDFTATNPTPPRKQRGS